MEVVSLVEVGGVAGENDSLATLETGHLLLYMSLHVLGISRSIDVTPTMLFREVLSSCPLPSTWKTDNRDFAFGLEGAGG